MSKKLHGLGVALVTPFNEKLEVDFEALTKLLQLSTAAQVDYWVVHGTTGENATTNLIEKKEILKFIQAHNPSRIPIVYGLGGNHTMELLHEIDRMDFEGIEAILTVTPYYNRPSQEGIYLHYSRLAEACPVPILLYNVPARTGSNIEPQTVIRLSAHPNILGIKEASGNLVACMEIANNKPFDFLLISGDDLLTVPIMAVGGVGVISTLANAFPGQMRAMIQAVCDNDYTTANQYQSVLFPLYQLITQGGNPVATKQILAALNIAKNHVRLPLTPASTSFIAHTQQVLQPWLE